MDRKRTILVVDDNGDDRAEIRRLLQQHRPLWRVAFASTGSEGLHMAGKERPDCILLDYHLPDMNGGDFLAALTTDDRHVDVPVAVLTGQEDDDVARSVLSRGAQDYLVKDGLSAMGLARAIENAIEKHQIRGELDSQRANAELRTRKLEALREELQHNLAELADAQESRDRFLAVMSHEMRTPLNAIIGYADLLDIGMHGELNPEQRMHLDRIRFGGRHLLDLINDVLDLARADARKLDLDLRPVDIVAALEEVTGLLESQAREKELTLHFEPDGYEPPLVQADLQRLRQVLANLIGNAIKFTEEGGVTVRCEAGPGGTVLVHVDDTGIGIDADVLPLVFDDFFQARGDLTREKGGSGLGLAIARRLAMLMGGEIRARSNVGEGSTFTLVLQAAPADAVRRADDVADQDLRRKGDAAMRDARVARTLDLAAGPSAGTVVVVAYGHDAAALTELERQVHPGVQLVWTVDDRDVPDLVVEHRPPLVVLDIGSSDGSGWRVANEVQANPELANTAVLLLPSIPEPTTVSAGDALDLGWVSLVPKPFTSKQLSDAVAVAAQRHREDDTGDGRGYNVMIVDDDPDSRRVAANFLQGDGIIVREEADGESALQAMRRELPDVVVLDLMMPVLDGFGVLATMRADPRLARIPVVVLTAKSLTEAERKFLARSAVRVLQKGEYRLADVAALVLRAAARPPHTGILPGD